MEEKLIRGVAWKPSRFGGWETQMRGGKTAHVSPDIRPSEDMAGKVYWCVGKHGDGFEDTEDAAFDSASKLVRMVMAVWEIDNALISMGYKKTLSGNYVKLFGWAMLAYYEKRGELAHIFTGSDGKNHVHAVEHLASMMNERGHSALVCIKLFESELPSYRGEPSDYNILSSSERQWAHLLG